MYRFALTLNPSPDGLPCTHKSKNSVISCRPHPPTPKTPLSSTLAAQCVFPWENGGRIKVLLPRGEGFRMRASARYSNPFQYLTHRCVYTGARWERDLRSDSLLPSGEGLGMRALKALIRRYIISTHIPKTGNR